MTRILKLFKQRKMAKNYGTHARPWPSRVRKNSGGMMVKIGRVVKNWQNQEFGGGKKAKFFQKRMRSGFLAIIRTLHYA